MPDTEKYMNTTNLGSEDENKFGWKLGDICHVGGGWVTANGYNYCGYEEFKVPLGARAKIIGVKQTNLNATYGNDAKGNKWKGEGDVYVDFELVDHTNSDGTPIRCGNRHGGTFAESNRRFAPCPDGSGDLGYLWEKSDSDSWHRWSGMWVSMMGEFDDNHKFTPQKMIDPKQYACPSCGVAREPGDPVHGGFRCDCWQQ